MRVANDRSDSGPITKKEKSQEWKACETCKLPCTKNSQPFFLTDDGDGDDDDDGDGDDDDDGDGDDVDDGQCWID